MSLLTLAQDVVALIGIEADPPSSVIGNSNTAISQLGSLAQIEGDELARIHDWQVLNRTLTITGDATTEFWDLPDDFDRFLRDAPLWQESRPFFPLDGPVLDQEFLGYQTNNQEPPFPIWRLVENTIDIWPVLASGDVVNGEYRTKYWVTDSTGDVEKARITSDSDEFLLPERVMVLGVVWRWKRAKGLEYAEDFRSYQMSRLQATMTDGGQKTSRLSQGPAAAGPRRRNAYRVLP
jgi:hypothetical protein